jgi:dTDP-L-rhamnose 4-epimerase
VVVLDALLPQAHGNAGAPRWVRRHEFVHGDVRERATLDRVLPGVDAVCHQAAMVGHGLDPSDAPDYASHNDYATAVLLAAMHAHGLGRLVLASSMVIYGEGRYRCAEHGLVRAAPRRQSDIDAGEFEPPCPVCGAPLASELVPEDAPADPRSTYAATKLAQEHLAGAWARQTGGNAWALRYHNVYGPRMPRDTPYAGVASIFRSALERGEAPRVMEDGRQRRDFVHVDDVARINALALSTEAPAGGCEPVNVCSGHPHTVGDLATELARAIDVRHIVADPAKARRVLGFRAEVSFADGVREFATAPLRAPVGGLG